MVDEKDRTLILILYQVQLCTASDVMSSLEHFSRSLPAGSIVLPRVTTTVRPVFLCIRQWFAGLGLFHRLYLRNFRLGPLSLRTVHWNVTGDALPKVIWHSIHYPVLSPRICRYRDPSAIPSRMRYAWICIGFTPSLIQLATTFITRLHNRVSEQSWGGAHPLSY